MASLIAEFKGSFGHYVEKLRDDREMILVAMLEQSTTDQLIELVEAHDLAALLSCAAYVDPTSRPTKLVRLAHKNETQADAETLRSAILVDQSRPAVVQLIDELIQSESGCEFLQTIVVCLAAGHKITGLSVDLWRP